MKNYSIISAVQNILGKVCLSAKLYIIYSQIKAVQS